MQRDLWKRLTKLELVIRPGRVNRKEINQRARVRGEEIRTSPKAAAEWFVNQGRLIDVRRRLRSNRDEEWATRELQRAEHDAASHLIDVLRRQERGPGANWAELIQKWKTGVEVIAIDENRMADPIFAGLFLELLSFGTDVHTSEIVATFCAREVRGQGTGIADLPESEFAELRSKVLWNWSVDRPSLPDDIHSPKYSDPEQPFC